MYIIDVVLDLWAVVSLYKEQNYIAMGVLIFLLLSSSILLNIFSWRWNTDCPPEGGFIIENKLLLLVHILQLGVFHRILTVAKISTCSFIQKTPHDEVSVNSNPNLFILQLFDAFLESAPQLILMMVLIMRMPELHLFTVIKTAVSIIIMAFSILRFHRNIVEFIDQKHKINWFSGNSITYFMCNLFLIGPRLVSVSLFASVLPWYIAVHFLCLWALLVLWAWLQKADYKNSKDGGWLLRATLGIIWYFSWFNVTNQNTKLRRIIYHVVMVMDIMLLLGLWWWRRSVESAYLSPLPINPYILIAMLIFSYIIGILLKMVYYWKFFPDKTVKVLLMHEKKEELVAVTRSNVEYIGNTSVKSTHVHDQLFEEKPYSSGFPESNTAATVNSAVGTEAESGTQNIMKIMANYF
ncbi:XK-related protein 8-like [Silurus meridionalis]|nr:XK-related protein 8-like [Silurus meridionalis]